MRAQTSAKTSIAATALMIVLRATTPVLAAGTDAEQRTITVSGQGEVKAAPDEAQLSAGVVTQGATAADALAANTKAMNRVFATLKQLGIPDKAMQTSDFSVSPQYQTFRNGNGSTSQRVSGYQVTNEVSVTIDDLKNLGDAIDALVGTGANSLGNIAFTIRDPKLLEAQARAAAMHDAMDKAETYAKAAGVSLGPILSVSEGGAEPRPVFRMAMAAAPMASTPIATGEQGISATVSVTFGIK